MQDEGECPLPAFRGQDFDHVLVGTSAMDDQRKFCDTRRFDMPGKTGLLVRRRLRVIEIVETGFADRHDLLM
ncbi:hypothetical protein D3C87_1963500 [compost metagenome]